MGCKRDIDNNFFLYSLNYCSNLCVNITWILLVKTIKLWN